MPVPTWQAVSDRSAVVRQAPPSIDALASRPGGRLSVRSSGESVPVGANLRSTPRLAVEPAAVPALWSSASVGEIDAPATGAVIAIAASTTTPARTF